MFTADDLHAANALAAAAATDTERTRDALDRLIRRHKPRIYGACLRITRDPERALALTRAVARAAWATLPHLDLDAERAWVWLANLAWQLSTQDARAHADPLTLDGVLASAHPATDALRRLSADERGAALDRAARHLPPHAQEVAHLRYVARLSPGAIEGALGRDDIENTLDHVRGKLRDALGQQLVGELRGPVSRSGVNRPPKAPRPDRPGDDPTRR